MSIFWSVQICRFCEFVAWGCDVHYSVLFLFTALECDFHIIVLGRRTLKQSPGDVCWSTWEIVASVKCAVPTYWNALHACALLLTSSLFTQLLSDTLFCTWVKISYFAVYFNEIFSTYLLEHFYMYTSCHLLYICLLLSFSYIIWNYDTWGQYLLRVQGNFTWNVLHLPTGTLHIHASYYFHCSSSLRDFLMHYFNDCCYVGNNNYGECSWTRERFLLTSEEFKYSIGNKWDGLIRVVISIFV